MKHADKKWITVILAAVALLIVVPLIALKGAEFGGSDDAGGRFEKKLRRDMSHGLILYWKP